MILVVVVVVNLHGGDKLTTNITSVCICLRLTRKGVKKVSAFINITHIHMAVECADFEGRKV